MVSTTGHITKRQRRGKQQLIECCLSHKLNFSVYTHDLVVPERTFEEKTLLSTSQSVMNNIVIAFNNDCQVTEIFKDFYIK